MDWTDSTMGWTLETSRDLIEWAHLDAPSYERPQTGSFKFTQDQDQQNFFRLRKVGSPRIYVVGDSISTPGAWPGKLAPLTGRHTFSQAIGGTTSPTMVNRARGVELVSPLTNPTTAGAIRMRWSRHIADRTHDSARRTEWAYYAKAVSEPVSIEVYQYGRFLGLAKRILKPFTTDFALNPKAIFCPGHGLSTGDRVTFISNDPGYPSDLSVTDSAAAWNFTSANLPSAIVERRVYYVANVTTDSFELKEFKNDIATLNIGSNALANQSIECGWEYNVNFTGGTWDVTWAARTKYDDCIWLLEVSANDFPGTATTVATVIIPNTQLLLNQMTEINPRYILVCPPIGSFTDRGPGTINWTNYYDTFMPWVRANYPNNYIDTMAIWSATRTAKELSLLLDPKTPECLWLAQTGTPTNEASWQVYRVATAGARQTWIGPGFTPLHLRTSFGDDIHPNNAGNKLISDAVAAKIAEKGW
ncbi:MAG: hypothetical protein WCS31_02275 [Verrucomicrobiae bacterium]